MAIKTFTDNTTLPASDINTFLANSGLVYIKQQAVGSAVTSVTVSDAFSATYDNYKLVYSGGVGSTAGVISLRMGATTTGYYGTLVYGLTSGGSPLVVPYLNTANWTHAAGLTTGGIIMDLDLCNPFATLRTRLATGCYQDDTAFGMINGMLADTTSYSAFTITANTGNFTGGIIYVYGYRKA